MGDDQDRDSGMGSSGSSGDAVISIYLSVPSVNKDERQRCLQYDPEDTVWTVKQTLLASISAEIVESFNYGLFCPPSKGRAGKFLDEERCMKDYGLGSVGKLELKYKSRVYKDLQPAMMRRDKLAQIQSKEALMKLMSKVMKCQVDRIKKLTGRGVDPNFIDPESGETPLTFSVRLHDPKPVMLALVEGGAHLDFRNSQTFTALHCAALRCSRKAISALLELGSSTNHQDCLGLTPLYHCVLTKDAAVALECIDLLLYDHAATDVVDDKGWTPLHQVCRSGRVQILDKLIFYGADMNCLNGNGNTPLHICALNNQEECARLLLFRGAVKSVPNNSSVDAEFLATKAGNERLVETITNFQPKDVVPYTEQPKRNPLRRTSPWIGSSGTIPRPRTIADFGGGLRTGLGSMGRQASLQLSGNASTPPGDEDNRTIINNNRSTMIQLSSMQFSSQERVSRIEPSQQHQHHQVALTEANDEYANLNNFAPVTAVNHANTSTSAVMASTTQWKNHQTAEIKKAAAAAEKEEYENLDECLQRCRETKANKNQLPYGSQSTAFLVSGSQHHLLSATVTSLQLNEQRKPMPPPASAKPKYNPGAEQSDDKTYSSDSSSIISGTGSLSSSGSATLTLSRPPMPQFGLSGATVSSSSDEHGFVLDAENLRREILRKQFAHVSSDDGLGGSIHSAADGGDPIYEPPPMPTWMPPPPPMMMNSAIETNSAESHPLQHRQTQQLSTSLSNNNHQSGGVSVGDDGFRELLARKAEQRTIADPTELKRNVPAVNSTGPLVTLRKTAKSFDSEDVSPQLESRPFIGSKPPPPTKQKNVRPTLMSSASVVHSSSSNPFGGHTHVKAPPSAPPTVPGSAFQRQTISTGSMWQMDAKKSFNPQTSVATKYSSVDVDDINSMILPPPPDDFLFNSPSSPTTAGPSPPFNPTSPEKFTTTTFRPPSFTNSPEVLSPPQAFKTNMSVTSVSRSNQLPVSPSTHQTMHCPPPPNNFSSTHQNVVAASKTTSSASFAKLSVAPKVTPAPPTNSITHGAAFGKTSQVPTENGNIAPPAAFSGGTVSTTRRREVAAAVAMQWKSTSNAAKTPATGSRSGQSAMVDWSQDDVQRWLESVQMSVHCDAFRTGRVDGRRLTTMTDDDLYYMGVREAGQRLMLTRAIKTALAND